MTKPPIPDNPITDFLNGAFDGTADLSLPAMMLISTVLAGAYLGAATLVRRTRKPKSMDLAFALAIATPLTSLIVLGAKGVAWGLIIGGIALVIGLVLWGIARGSRNQEQQNVTR